MRGTWQGILSAYGQTVERTGTGEQWRAFVQPVLAERSEEERRSTALGDVDRRRWLYIGPADRRLERETRLTCGGRTYRVRESVTVQLGEEVLYRRAVLVPEREMVT